MDFTGPSLWPEGCNEFAVWLARTAAFCGARAHVQIRQA
jgi:hypothetical protein